MLAVDMLRRATVLGTCVALAAATAGLSQPPGHRETATVTAVEIPVQVVVDGRPVRGLTVENFEVFEKRLQHPIVGFEAVDLVAVAPEDEAQTLVSPHARRRFVLLFDLSFSSPSAVVRARRAARDVVLSRLTARDLVAVATYASSRGARIVLGFTSDRWQIEWALQSLGLVEPIEKVSDPLGIMLADLEGTLSQNPSRGLGSGRPDSEGREGIGDFDRQWVVDSIFLENLRDLSAEVGERNREVVEKQILSMASAYGELARLLDSAQGQKQIILLSEGFDSRVLLGADDAQRVAEIAEQSARGEVWRIRSDERFGSSAAQGGLSEMIEEFRRRDCVIQAVDIGGLRAGPGATGPARGEHGLYLMAAETGGELYRNFNDLGAAMDEILERTAAAYVLVVQPPDVLPDGSFHRLKVKLKNGPKKARLLHRPGYFAPLPFTDLTASQRRLGAADLLIAGEAGGSLDVAVLAVPDLSSRGEGRVLAAIDVDRDSLSPFDSESRVPLELYAYAFDGRGRLRDFFAEMVELEPASLAGHGEAAGLKFFGDLRLPEGEYALRVLARNGRNGDSGVAVASVRVPRSDEPVLLPPLVLVPEKQWLIAGEPSRSWLPETGSTAVAGGGLVPVARPALAAEHVVLLVARHPDADRPAAEAVLRTIDGRPAAELKISLEEPQIADNGRAARFWARLQAGPVAAGDYRLEVSLDSARAGHRLTSSIPVTIVRSAAPEP